ncbi:Protein of unknown function [Terriglobus roseus]|uniref:DUF5060 domain-containing protein n=2 Tax=Terriglobus roseus TaxID=392734 RepID=A0A1H4M1T3_9BACT|nr:Protein of unknown function [Terriglobus roseus]
MLKVTAGVAAGLIIEVVEGPVADALPGAAEGLVALWDCFEVSLPGPADGNPFLEVTFAAKFSQGSRVLSVPGFYDGDGRYMVRFMPDAVGDWTYVTESNVPTLAGHKGGLRVVAASGNNHGPVRVAHRFHFAFADGKPYFPFGTTCYSMGFMGEPYETQTLDALRTAGFNKVRLCLMPKGQGSRPEPRLPFVKIPANDGRPSHFDAARFDPEFFRHFEQRVLDLQRMGIEADVILFHPYDGWGLKSMSAEEDDRYLRYAVARLAAYRNVWWSIANEYDLVKTRTMTDWDRHFQVVVASDPYEHLRSIHHSKVVYDHGKPWCTHASLQEYDFNKSEERRQAWGKPIVYDEIQYEGNIARRWGNLSAEEMTRRFWLATVAGAYATHGDTFLTPPGEPVWSDGGKLRGSSAPRIKFLREIVEGLPTAGLNEFVGAYYLSAGIEGQVYLYYFDFHALAEYDFPLPAGITFKGWLIDPFAMTRMELPGTYTGKTKGTSAVIDENVGQAAAGGTNHLVLPGRPGMAALFVRVGSSLRG